MNIISNNCAGADVYKLLKQPYNNPFMWCCTFPDDMVHLIENFFTIKLYNVIPIPLEKSIADANNYYEYRDDMFGLSIDNQVNTYFVHYLFDNEKIEPYKDGVNVFYYRNYEYIYEKYLERLSRMFKCTEPPSFLLVTYRRQGWTKSKISRLEHLNTLFKVFIITDVRINPKQPNIMVKYNFQLNNEQNMFPIKQVNTYLPDIMGFFGI